MYVYSSTSIIIIIFFFIDTHCFDDEAVTGVIFKMSKLVHEIEIKRVYTSQIDFKPEYIYCQK